MITNILSQVVGFLICDFTVGFRIGELIYGTSTVVERVTVSVNLFNFYVYYNYGIFSSCIYLIYVELWLVKHH